MHTLLTFGDSNTHGTPPIETRGEVRRFPAGVRWPTVALGELGADWLLVEEGLPGRTTMFDDPIMGTHMDGRLGLKIALASHGPIDVLTIMLGTNDSKMMFGTDAERITAGMAGLLAIAQSEEMQDRHGGFKTLVICPPAVKVQGPINDIFYKADGKGAALAPHYKALAAHWGVHFFDAGTVIETSQQDGVHFTADAHQALGQAIAKQVKAIK